MARALIIGAGAIGRGYLPWELKDLIIDFYDTNEALIDSLNKNKTFTSFMSFGDRLKELRVTAENFYSNTDDIDFTKYDIAFICIGPRNLKFLDVKFKELSCPLFSLENDDALVFFLRDYLGKDDIFFGVPDVITSLTASPINLINDPNSLHTENGVLYLEDNNSIDSDIKLSLPNINWIDKERMMKEWHAKLYIHNTPHCIAAFYGNLNQCTYLHEALEIDYVKDELFGVVDEVLQTLKVKTNYEHKFLEWYAEKEISRFANVHLFDPISRVGREPLRKLKPGGRLLGIMTMALESGIVPIHLSRGIAAALHYDLKSDPDNLVIRNIENMGIDAFLRYMIKVDPKTIQGKMIKDAYEQF
jgi:mannitol-1-phosphate 5-dehydrogenase